MKGNLGLGDFESNLVSTESTAGATSTNEVPTERKAKGRRILGDAVMFALYLHFLAFLTLSSSQSAVPQYLQGQWLASDDDSQYDALLPIGAETWPESSTEAPGLTPAEDLTPLSTTARPQTMAHQEAKEVVEESSVWKIALVVAVLLVSIVGSLSLAYYLCIWRGGRIYYQPQKEGYP